MPRGCWARTRASQTGGNQRGADAGLQGPRSRDERRGDRERADEQREQHAETLYEGARDQRGEHQQRQQRDRIGVKP